MLSQDSSMNDQEKRYNIEHRLNDLTNVLHRPVETAVISRPFTRYYPNGCFRG